MTPREIIAEAWAITRREKALRRWGVSAAFLETLLDVKLVSYQAYFLWEYLQGGQAGFWDIEILLFHSVPFWAFLTIVGLLGFMIVIEFFVPHMALGAIIGLAAKSFRGETVRGGFVLAIYNFLPIFTVREIFFLGSISTVATAISLVLRYVPGDMKTPIIIGLAALWIISNILKFFASFAEEAIVVRRRGMFVALGESFKLIISNLGHVMFLLLLLFVISIRILINMLTVLVIPGLTIGLGYLLATILSPVLSTIIAVCVGIVLIVLAGYFFGYLHVFKETVWTITYLELSGKKDLSVIVE